MSNLSLGPSTELDAVNEMLGSIGEDPLTDLSELPPSGNTALATLRAVSRDLQEQGFTFNTEAEVPYAPNTDGEVRVPGNVLRIDASDAASQIVQRGSRLYDAEARSYAFSAAVSCDVVLHLPWDELPSVARRYFTALAVEKFVEGFPGADPTSQSRQRNLLRAEAAFRRAELRNGDHNLLTGSSFIQNVIRRS